MNFSSPTSPYRHSCSSGTALCSCSSSSSSSSLSFNHTVESVSIQKQEKGISTSPAPTSASYPYQPHNENENVKQEEQDEEEEEEEEETEEEEDEDQHLYDEDDSDEEQEMERNGDGNGEEQTERGQLDLSAAADFLPSTLSEEDAAALAATFDLISSCSNSITNHSLSTPPSLSTLSSSLSTSLGTHLTSSQLTNMSDSLHRWKKQKRKLKHKQKSSSSSSSIGPSRSARAGITFPIGAVTRALKRGEYAQRVGGGAPVYVAAVLEYLTTEILDCAAQQAKLQQQQQREEETGLELGTGETKEKRKKKSGGFQITPSHLHRAVVNDSELSAVLQQVATATAAGVATDSSMNSCPTTSWNLSEAEGSSGTSW